MAIKECYYGNTNAISESLLKGETFFRKMKINLREVSIHLCKVNKLSLWTINYV